MSGGVNPFSRSHVSKIQKRQKPRVEETRFGFIFVVYTNSLRVSPTDFYRGRISFASPKKKKKSRKVDSRRRFERVSILY